jgi:hypothetical protein
MRRGNSVRPSGGSRRSNVAGFPAYPETLRPGQGPDGQPIDGETSAVPPPVILNGSALPKAAAVVVEVPSANDDEVAPDSSTRSKDEVVAKEEPKVEEAPKPEVEAKEATKPEPTVKMRTDRPDRAERRSRERKGGKGRSAAPPPVVEKEPVPKEEPKSEEPKASAAPAVETSAEKAASTADKAPAPIPDLDDRFFAEGVDSEQEMLAAAAKSVRPSLPIEEEIDPKILLKLHPDVRARRAKYGNVAKWVGIGCVVLLGAAGLVRYLRQQDSEEQAKIQMAEYAAAHTYTAPVVEPPPPASAAAPTAAATTSASAAAPADSTTIPPPADSAAANPAGEKAALGPESKTVAAAAPSASGAAAGAVQADTESPPAKTAQQEKRDMSSFLERGAFGSAVAAGQRSVSLDPSDGEAWLLLGAAYQSSGRAGDAKRAYNSCLTQAKRGPIGECRAMLQ